METVLIFGLLTFFASLVANRASNLGRNAWAWGIAGWLISPLGVWIVLEICGRKKEKPVPQSVEAAGEQHVLPLQESQLSQDNATIL